MRSPMAPRIGGARRLQALALAGLAGWARGALAPSADVPYDCATGLSNWTHWWSYPKKQWCCANGGVGCLVLDPGSHDTGVSGGLSLATGEPKKLAESPELRGALASSLAAVSGLPAQNISHLIVDYVPTTDPRLWPAAGYVRVLFEFGVPPGPQAARARAALWTARPRSGSSGF